MAEFMRQHRGQLISAGGHPDQAQMNAQVAARQGEGVDAFVANQHQVPGETLLQLGGQLATLARCLDQGLPDALDVVAQNRVFDQVGIAQKFTRNAVTQPALFAQGHVTAITQRGQSMRRRRLCLQRRGGHAQQEAEHDPRPAGS